MLLYQIAASLGMLAAAIVMWRSKGQLRPTARLAIIACSIALLGVTWASYRQHLKVDAARSELDQRRDALGHDLDALTTKFAVLKAQRDTEQDPKAKAEISQRLRDLSGELANDQQRLDAIKRDGAALSH